MYIVETGYGFCLYYKGRPIEGTERLTREEVEELLNDITK